MLCCLLEPLMKILRTKAVEAKKESGHVPLYTKTGVRQRSMTPMNLNTNV
jgi:hypothetical protein